MTEEESDDLDLSTLSDEELVEQMHDDLYDGLKVEIGKHTSELQSRSDLVCRLLLEKKKSYSLFSLNHTPPTIYTSIDI